MSKIINKTTHAVVIDGVLLVPGKPIEGLDTARLTKLFPDFAKMVDAKEIEIIGDPTKRSLEDMSWPELVELAKEKGIAGARTTSRAALLEALKAK